MTERRSKLLVVFAVWLSFLVVSLSSSPIPGVNESHYLTKSKHFWNPEWCSRDFFLTSFSAHRVFYQTVGCLTLWFDLPTVAVIGRVVGMGLLAISWTTLVSRLTHCSFERDRSSIGEQQTPQPTPWAALLSAWIFLGLQAIGNLSGEWLIGGLESKVIAFAFVFWGISARLTQRFKTAALCGGAAIAFHPIVGLWHVVAMGFAEVPDLKSFFADLNSSRPRRRLWVEAALLIVTALPGLWPAFQLLQTSDSRASYVANFVQVFYRLKHHLDPMDFGIWNYAGYVLLALIWTALLIFVARRERFSLRDRWWMAYIAATALFAFCGFLVGLGVRPAQEMWGYRWRMGLLKFYPFRLFDLMLPVAVAVIAARVMGGRRQRLVWTIAFLGFAYATVEEHLHEPPLPWTRQARTDWKSACAWIAANTPTDSLFLTPIESDSFKWYAQRAEVVNFKDCPQDAAGIVEWNQRLQWLDRWSKAAFEDQRYSVEELHALRRKTKAEFAMARSRVPYEADLIYSNETFNVFRLPNLPE